MPVDLDFLDWADQTFEGGQAAPGVEKFRGGLGMSFQHVVSQRPPVQVVQVHVPAQARAPAVGDDRSERDDASVAQVLFTLWVLSLIIFNEDMSYALGGAEYAIHLNLVAFAILFSPISGITGLFMSIYSRKNEFEADAYAKQTNNGKALADALKKLSVDSLSNLFPHPWYVFFHYSHPPLLKRLEAIDR